MEGLSRGKKMLKTSLQPQIDALRSSSRKKPPLEQAIWWMKLGLDQDGFVQKYINDYKGYGVFAEKEFKKGDFLLEYVGEMIGNEQAIQREKNIDATSTRGRLGHLVNDAPIKNANGKMKLMGCDGPRLCLFAIRDIHKGDELLYDYGDGKNLWWRQEKAAKEKIDYYIDPDPFDVEKRSRMSHIRVRETEEAEPELPQSEGTEPELPQSEGTEPEQPQSEGAEPKLTQSEGTEPELPQSEGTEPELPQSEGTEPELPQSEGTEPELPQSEGTEPELPQSEGTEPELPQSEGTEPELPQSEGTEPELPQSEGTEPELPQSEGADPKLTQSEGTEPELPQSEGTEPELTQSEGTEPELPQSEGAEPKLTQSEGTEPELPQSEGTEPELTQSEGTEPDDTMTIKKMEQLSRGKLSATHFFEDEDGAIHECVPYSYVHDLKYSCDSTGSILGVHEVLLLSEVTGEFYSDSSPNTLPVIDDEYVEDSCDSFMFPDQGTQADMKALQIPAHTDEVEDSFERLSDEGDPRTTNSAEDESSDELPQEEPKEKKTKISQKSKVKDGCKQVYDKINYCTFCGIGIRSKISRHLLTVHKDEERVSAVRFLEKRSKERMDLLGILANEGNFKHNSKVLNGDGGGCIVVGRRRSHGQNQHNARDFLPCEYCKKFILASSLWHHNRTCSLKNSYCSKTPEDQKELCVDHCEKDTRNAVRRGRNLLQSAIMKDDIPSSQVFNRMRSDEVKDVAFGDSLIRRYAALRVESLGDKDDQKLGDMHRISQGARTLARLVLEARKQLPCVTLDGLLKPDNFDLVINSTKALSYHTDRPALSLGKLVGNLIGHVIQIKTGQALRCNQEQKCEEANKFQKLYQAEWNYRINSVGLRKLSKLKRNKVKVIPLTDDLLMFTQYLKGCIQQEVKNLQKSADAGAWSNLAKLTMCRLILFNKRRRAEVKDLKVLDYQNRPNWQDDTTGDLEMALTPFDKMLAKRMDMVLSAGKSRKNVDAYILLPPDAKLAVDLLIKTREAVKVSSTNPYVFARLNADTPYTGNTELRTLVDNCPGLKDSKRVTSSSLRRYIATVSQVLDMSDQELQILATHLGHDPKTHKEFYRISHSSIELSKVSQLLMAVERGEASKWRGRKLSDITVEELPDVRYPTSD